ncbi:DUF2513 domain-containing protein [Veillonella caviae]|uniref:DUF2513 domain-containing protein n=1 Tax=Veillonella caviae TaxID=248316 RepID=UPI0023F74C11|nr:DUF2513 domain-containing protein [Veillonella caviae]MCI7693554.1 DUF2513 domain-containing protein [Veillonella caviae]MDY5253178.1 DUF2513 domain-containing protein [Veillonella caviae]
MMKRDLDLIRNILFTIENSNSIDASLTLNSLSKLHQDQELILYHVFLLDDAGFIIGIIDETAPYISITRLTNEGHDYLDTIRDDSVWNQTKSTLGKISGSASLEVVKTIASKLALTFLGL